MQERGEALVGVFMPCVGEGERHPGGVEPGMPEGALDEPEGHAGFKQRGGVRRSERMESQAGCGDPGALCGLPEGALDPIAAHGKRGGRTVRVIASGGGKEPGCVPVCPPGGPHQHQGLCGEGDSAILGTLASMDMDKQTLRVNVGNVQGESFMEPESEALDRGKGDLVVQRWGGIEEAPDFLDAADSGETVCGLGAEERQGVPVTREDVLGEERDAAGAEAHGSRGEVVDVCAVQEGVLEFRFGDEVRGFIIELSEQAHLTDRGLLGAFARATELEGGNHVLAQRGHEISPFLS